MLTDAGLPAMLPRWLHALPQLRQIHALMLAAVLAYGVHVGARKLVEFVCQRGACQLVTRARKTGLFNNQTHQASVAYKRAALAMASCAAVGLGSVVLSWAHPPLVVLLWGWLLATCSMMTVPLRRIFGVRQWLSSRLHWCLELWGFSALVCALFLLAHQFASGQDFALMPLVIGLIALRQSVGQAIRGVQCVHGLHAQRSQAFALFLPHVPWQNAAPAQGEFEILVAPEGYRRWLWPLLAQLTPLRMPDPEDLLVELQWLDGGLIAALWIRPRRHSPDRDGVLVKLFRHSRDSASKLESDLLQREAAQSLCAFTLLTSRKIRGFNCHVMLWPAGWEKATGPDEAKGRESLRHALLCHVPSSELAVLAMRSRTMLWNRLNDDAFEQLARAAEMHRQGPAIQRLRDQWPIWKEELRALPLQVALPGWGGGSLMHDGQGHYAAFDWSGWRLEPVGGAWQVNGRTHASIDRALTQARTARAELANCGMVQVSRCAHLYEIERRCGLRNWSSALPFVIPLLELTDSTN